VSPSRTRLQEEVGYGKLWYFLQGNPGRGGACDNQEAPMPTVQGFVLERAERRIIAVKVTSFICFFHLICDPSRPISELQHPSLGAWVAICVDMELCSVMEYIKGKSLHDYLQQPNTEIRLDWVLDVAKVRAPTAC